MFTDTHCHLSYGELYSNLDQALENAKKSEVNKIITMGNNYQDALVAQEISEKTKSVYYAVGLHPEDCMEGDLDRALEEVADLAPFIQNSKCVAIGEIGLDHRWLDSLSEDKYQGVPGWRGVAEEIQLRVFERLLDWSLEVDYPVVVHCRESEKEMFPLLDNFTRSGGRGVLHSFTGNLDFMQHFVSKGWFVSFNGIITFKNGQNVRELLEYVPLDQVLFETDAPFLAPEPYRGQMCEPKHVVAVYKMAAEIRGANLGNLSSVVEDNISRLFGI